MTSPDPLVSVVIPFHNAARWIGETVQAVAAQGGVALELVLVDDGSDDDSLRVAENAAGGIPLIVVRQEHSGVSRARNAGTAAARGAFIQFVDADDVLLPETLALRLDTLSRTGGDVAYCDWMLWDEQPDGTFAHGEIIRHRVSDQPEVEILRGTWWPLAALLYRKETVAAIGGWHENLPIVQDARFLLDAALTGARFVAVDHIGVKYRRHTASLSRKSTLEFFEDCYRNGLDLQAKWDREGSLDPKRRRSLATLYAWVAREFFPIDRRRFNDAIAHLKDLDPSFVPDGSATLRLLSRTTGYANAVRVATWYRQLNPLG